MGGVASRDDVALLGRPGNRAGRRIVVLRYGLCCVIVGADAAVDENRIQILHVARVDAIVADGDRLRLRRREAGLQRKPLRQAEMHVALVGMDDWAREHRERGNRKGGATVRQWRDRESLQWTQGLAASSSTPGGAVP